MEARRYVLVTILKAKRAYCHSHVQSHLVQQQQSNPHRYTLPNTCDIKCVVYNINDYTFSTCNVSIIPFIVCISSFCFSILVPGRNPYGPFHIMEERFRWFIPILMIACVSTYCIKCVCLYDNAERPSNHSGLLLRRPCVVHQAAVASPPMAASVLFLYAFSNIL